MPDIQHEPRQLFVGAALMLVTGVIQTFGIITLDEYVDRARATIAENMTRARMLFVLCGVIFYLFGLHLLEMSLWAGVFQLLAGYQGFAAALYESSLAFTTMDTARLPPQWKYLSAAEGITGLLMFAWSTSALFNHTSWVTEARRQYLRQHRMFGSKQANKARKP